LTFSRSRRSSGGSAITASWIATWIVSGLSSGFSAHAHEIEYVFAVVGVYENDFPAGSIRAVRPTLPRGS
jgi:hypothetical protein